MPPLIPTEKNDEEDDENEENEDDEDTENLPENNSSTINSMYFCFFLVSEKIVSSPRGMVCNG